MATRDAACHCGQLRLEVDGDPFAVSICNCLACQRRTGSAFGMQAGFKADQVAGRRPLQRLLADLGRGGPEGARLPLLPRLRLAGLLHRADGAGPDRRLGRRVRRPVVPAADRVGLRLAAAPVDRAAGLDRALRARAVGAGAPALRGRQVRGGGGRGRELLEAHPDRPTCYYNVACCESLAGRTADAIEHLRRAIERGTASATMARGRLGLRSDPRRARVPRTDA